MAHSCSECYSTCYCGGDIDDILFDDDSEEAMECTYCPVDGGSMPDDFDEIYDDYIAE